MPLTFGTLEYGQITNMRHKAKTAADAAAHAALRDGSKRIVDGQEFGVTSDYLKPYAERAFNNAMAEAGMWGRVKGLEFKHVNNDATLELRYEYKIPTLMSTGESLVVDQVKTASNVHVRGIYMHLHLLLDFSGSMSTAATKQGQIELTKINNNCAFACHVENIQKAHDAGIDLRQDKLRTALDALVLTAENSAETYDLDEDSVQFSIDQFQTFLTNRQKPTTDLDEVRQSIAALPTQAAGGTDLAFALTRTAMAMPDSGTGASQQDRRSFVMLITDGITNRGNRVFQSPGGRGTVDAADCSAIKDKGIVLAVLYTKYENYADTFLAATGRDSRRGHFNHHVALPVANVENQLKECASPGFFFMSDDMTTLSTEFDKLFSKAVKETKAMRVRVVE